jgi:peptidyl-prolyl cis-trans isomerase A (cyclophilin A)
MTCTLFPDKAPIGVENFIGLATGTKDWKTVRGRHQARRAPLRRHHFSSRDSGLHDSGRRPAGDGTGDPGYKFKNEVSSDLLFDKPGRLAYANAGPNTNGSQFFITEVATPHLNGNYTIFGQCDDCHRRAREGNCAHGHRSQNDRPFRPVKIIHIKIVRGGAPARCRGEEASSQCNQAAGRRELTTLM